MRQVYTVIEGKDVFSTFDIHGVEIYLRRHGVEDTDNIFSLTERLMPGRVSTFKGNDRKVKVCLSMVRV